jgi:hypothetical protein
MPDDVAPMTRRSGPLGGKNRPGVLRVAIPSEPVAAHRAAPTRQRDASDLPALSRACRPAAKPL